MLWHWRFDVWFTVKNWPARVIFKCIQSHNSMTYSIWLIFNSLACFWLSSVLFRTCGGTVSLLALQEMVTLGPSLVPAASHTPLCNKYPPSLRALLQSSVSSTDPSLLVTETPPTQNTYGLKLEFSWLNLTVVQWNNLSSKYIPDCCKKLMQKQQAGWNASLSACCVKLL